MEIVRYVHDGIVQVGVRKAGTVAPLRWAPSIAGLLGEPLAGLPARLEDLGPPLDPAAVTFLPPVDGSTEVWAAGVTYEKSREGRVEESSQSSVYEKVYDAPRPELFLKSVAWRVVTDGEPIGVRADSDVDVPEPELAVVANRFGETVGYTVCNDVSSRDIEGQNPLYIPQAKMYSGSCALATGIVPAWEVPDPHDLTVTVGVVRDGGQVWTGQTSTARLHRNIEDLVSVLYAPIDFPGGAVLATGTGIVPGLGFSLTAGDRVDITVDGVGSLSNPVVRGREPMTWLTDAAEHPESRKVPQ